MRHENCGRSIKRAQVRVITTVRAVAFIRLQLLKSIHSTPPKRAVSSTHRVTKQRVTLKSSTSQSLSLACAVRRTRRTEPPQTHTRHRHTFEIHRTIFSPTMAESSKAQPPSQSNGPVYFWKPDQGHGYLGQWFWSPWTHEGNTYKTAEMWMMVGKARLFGDDVSSPFAHRTTG